MVNRINNLLVFLLLGIGMFFPTSSAGVINEGLESLQYIILLMILGVLFLINKKSKKGLLHASLIIFILILSTGVTIFSGRYTNIFFTGIMFQYILLSLMFVIDFSKIKLHDNFEKVFFSFNLATVSIGLLVVLNYAPAKDFLLNNYSSFYQQLLTLMFLSDKPVFVFGTHSLAGLFYYLLFFMNFKVYLNKKNMISLLFSVVFLALMFFLRSTTAYILLGIALAQLLYYLSKKSLPLLFLTVLILFFVLNNNFETISYNISRVANANITGFAGRYSSSGALNVTIDYIFNHLTPIGIVNVPGLYYTDSGWIMNILRGSLLFFVIVYLGFYSFLRRNLINKRTALWIFIIIFSFEVGFQGLTYIRLLYFLPFFTIYLNNFALESN